MFQRLHTDGTAETVALQDLYGGPSRTWCWIICGGPSLGRLPVAEISGSPAPKFAVNLAGSGLIRPNFWTSYDPTVRFHKSIYLDPGIIKFLHRCRAMDLIPETTCKVCDAPATLFFDRDRERGFHNFLETSRTSRAGIVDWQDSLIQAIDLAVQLGFRRLLLAGCDMFIAPSEQQLDLARRVGVEYQPRELLRSFFDRCRAQGITWEDLCQQGLPTQYHFDEHKPLAAAVQTDDHYFRVAQYLRLSRKSIARAGVELISVTPVSRLNDDFPFLRVKQAIARILQDVGNPGSETTRGRYTRPETRRPACLGPMKDFRPHFWQPKSSSPQLPPSPEPQRRTAQPIAPHEFLKSRDIEIPINEIA